MNKLHVSTLVLLSILNCSPIKAEIVHDYVSEANKKNNNFKEQNRKTSLQPKLEEEETDDNEKENWSEWSFRHGKNVAYATTIVAGTAAIGAATGGVGAIGAAQLGMAITASTGATAGGITGAGLGLGMAIEEFDSEESSSASHLAASIGKGVMLGFVAYPVLTYCAIGGLTESGYVGASYLSYLAGRKILKK